MDVNIIVKWINECKWIYEYRDGYMDGYKDGYMDEWM